MTESLDSGLDVLVHEVELHVAADGWDQPARLFALVDTARLLAEEPSIAAQVDTDGMHPLTPVEQEGLPPHDSLEELLATLAWPEAVTGTAVVVERILLPAGVEEDLPADEEEALRVVSEHPERREVRIAVAVLRDGSRASAIRLREHDADSEVLAGPDLVPGLGDALAATLSE